jgi:SAM-dependent methyltransferase
LKGGSLDVSDWYEDEELWRELEPFLFTEQRLGAADEEVGQILELAGRPVESALDLCCGPGRHALALARRGVAVTGVDRTALYLERARGRAEAEGLKVDWRLEDMVEHRRPSAYDLAISLFSSFGYFEDEEDDLRVLRNLHESLRPGGALVMEMVSKEWIARHFQELMCDTLPDGSMLVRRHEIVEGWSRIRNRWTVIRGDRARSLELHIRIFSGAELRDRLLGAGFEAVRLCGGFDGGDYGFDSERLVAVATR